MISKWIYINSFQKLEKTSNPFPDNIPLKLETTLWDEYLTED